MKRPARGASSLCGAFLAAGLIGGCGAPGPGWSSGEPMPVARGEVAAALGLRSEGCATPPCAVAAVVGGYAFPAVTQARVDGYLVDEDRWIGLPDLPRPRHHAAAAGLPDGTIVASGGAAASTDERPRADVWALAPDAAGWAPFDPLPEGRWGHRMLAVDDRLIVIGGHGGDATLVWSTDTGWETAAPIPMARDHLGAAVIDGEVWAIGGRDPTFTPRIDIYDPEADVWREGLPLPAPTSAAVVGVLDRIVVVVSGERYGVLEGGVVEAAWMLDLDAEPRAWQALTPPPVDVHGAGDVVVGAPGARRLLVFGGASWHAQWSIFSWTRTVQVLEDPVPEGGR